MNLDDEIRTLMREVLPMRDRPYSFDADPWAVNVMRRAKSHIYTATDAVSTSLGFLVFHMESVVVKRMVRKIPFEWVMESPWERENT